MTLALNGYVVRRYSAVYCSSSVEVYCRFGLSKTEDETVVAFFESTRRSPPPPFFFFSKLYARHCFLSFINTEV